MENFKKRAIDLIMGLAITEEKMPSVIPYAPAKTEYSGAEKKHFKRRIGGKGKIYAKLLSDMLVALEAEKRANLHSIMVIKDGEVILEASHPGYDVNTAHLAHSMSKTVTGIAIGLLVDEGKLELSERLVDIFPEITFKDKRFTDITVEHLLTMKSGVPFSELGTVTEDRWTEAYFASELAFAPGERFGYNSMNSYILAEIVTRVTNISLSEYLAPRLFEPLGITNYFWEKSPEGFDKGGFGLYMSCESFAKIGVLLLGGGVFEGKRIVSERWVTESTKSQVAVPEEKGSFNYGYHVWVSRTADSFGLNGMLGQNVWIYPKHNIVVSMNAGNNEIFQDSPALSIVMKFLSNMEGRKCSRHDHAVLKYLQKHFFENRHWIRPLAPKNSISCLLGLADRRPFDPMWNQMLGTYVFPDNNTGILPLFVRVLQNNFLGGIESFEFRRDDEELIFVSREGGIEYEIPIGLYGYRETLVNFDGENYILRAFGEAMEDEDRNPVYKIEFIFPEIPNTRMIKLTRTPTGIRVRMNEMPNQRIADSFLATMTSGGTIGFAMGIIERRAGEDFIERKLQGVFNPELFGVDTRTEGWEDIIAAENRAIAERHEKSGKFIRTMMNKFIGDDKPSSAKQEKEKHKEKHKDGQNFLKRAINAIMSRKRKKTDIKVKDYVELEVENIDSPALPESNPVHEPAETKNEESSFITVIDDDGELSVVSADTVSQLPDDSTD